MWTYLLSLTTSHITLSPNYGAASGGNFATHLKIPHGHENMHTTRIVLQLPRGIARAIPEVPAGWYANITYYDLESKDRYISHGIEVMQAPDKITWTTLGSGVSNDHLLQIGLQLKLLCTFSDPVQDDYSGSNSIWQGQHTLWFKVEQHSSAENMMDRMYNWNAALKDNSDGTSPSWNPPYTSGLQACPYLFIHSGMMCNVSDDIQGGMVWMNSFVPPTQNRGQVLHEQHVIDIATEAALTVHESLEESKESHRHMHELEHIIQELHIDIHQVEYTLENLKEREQHVRSITYVSLVLSICGLCLLIGGAICFSVRILMKPKLDAKIEKSLEVFTTVNGQNDRNNESL